jgi:hypothetical protein
MDTNSLGAATLAVRNPDGAVSNQVTIPIKDYPQLSLPNTISFSPQAVNTSSIQTATVTNSGTDALAVSFSTASPFAVSTDCPNPIPATASCTISVGFSPTTPGVYSSAVNVLGDTNASIELKATAGLATATLSALPSSVTFTPLVSNSSPSDATVLVTNIGLPEVTINNVSVDSSDFQAIPYLGTGPMTTGVPGMIAVNFRPLTAGTHSGNLIIDSTAGRLVVPLTGTIDQHVSFDTTALNIQALKGQIGPSTAVATFTNSGSSPVSIGALGINSTNQLSTFLQSNNCPYNSNLLGGGAPRVRSPSLGTRSSLHPIPPLSLSWQGLSPTHCRSPGRQRISPSEQMLRPHRRPYRPAKLPRSPSRSTPRVDTMVTSRFLAPAPQRTQPAPCPLPN